jgi:hypothetical protein
MFRDLLNELKERFSGSKVERPVPVNLECVRKDGSPVEPNGSIKGMALFKTCGEIITLNTLEETHEKGIDISVDDDGNLVYCSGKYRILGLLSVETDKIDLFYVAFAAPNDNGEKKDRKVIVREFDEVEDFLYYNEFYGGEKND